MTYREYTRGKKERYYRQRSRGQKPIRIAELPARSPEYWRAVAALKALLGEEGYYKFSKTLPDHIVLDERRHLAAIRAELWKLESEAEMFACKQYSAAEGGDVKLP